VNFGYGYPYYGYGGYGYGYGYPYYYHRPTIGLAYSTYGGSVYRGVPVNGYYSDSLAVDVQRELRRRGYYHGAIDGDIGPASRSAIRAYQADRGLGVTGRIDSRLLRSLGVG
jgi:peptidoglycan hydrolase-like protein with peptidoglycan-binding domain